MMVLVIAAKTEVRMVEEAGFFGRRRRCLLNQLIVEAVEVVGQRVVGGR